MKHPLFTSADILLPKENFENWAVIACDQFTSNSDYWRETEALTNGHPSALHLIYPEYYLGKTDPNEVTERINRTMREYLEGDVYRHYPNAMIYIERIQSDGRMRAGIVGAVDLDAYDYTPGSNAAVRATEATVLERIPPRVAIRRDAPTELPHVMMLLDDRKCEIIEPLATLATEGGMEKLYDFDLMQGGGHLCGYLIPADLQARISNAVEALGSLHGGMSMAVGDGNHSLATAKECRRLSPTEKNRYALCELVNLYSPALSFEPIYRTVEHIDPEALLAAFHDYLAAHADESGVNAPQDITFVTRSDRKTIHVAHPPHALAVGTVQAFLDAYLPTLPGAAIDYIHGEDEVQKIVSTPNSCGFLYDCMQKDELFPAVAREGVLPRKTFSMGHARDKRYYVEVREI